MLCFVSCPSFSVLWYSSPLPFLLVVEPWEFFFLFLFAFRVSFCFPTLRRISTIRIIEFSAPIWIEILDRWILFIFAEESRPDFYRSRGTNGTTNGGFWKEILKNNGSEPTLEIFPRHFIFETLERERALRAFEIPLPLHFSSMTVSHNAVKFR